MLIIETKSHVITIHDSFGCDLLSMQSNINIIKQQYGKIILKTDSLNSDLIIKNQITSDFIML